MLTRRKEGKRLGEGGRERKGTKMRNYLKGEGRMKGIRKSTLVLICVE